MTLIAFPDFFDDPKNFLMRPRVNQRAAGSTYDGSEQVVDFGNDRWTASFELCARTHEEAADLEAFWASLRGTVNTVNLYHLVRPEPRGTLRGNLSIFLATGKGSAAVYLKGGTAGATLLPGDMIGVSGMLLQVATLCVCDGLGQIGVPIVNRLRRSTVVDEAVTWNRPSVPFRQVAEGEGVQYVPGYAPECSFDFIEAL